MKFIISIVLLSFLFLNGYLFHNYVINVVNVDYPMIFSRKLLPSISANGFGGLLVNPKWASTLIYVLCALSIQGAIVQMLYGSGKLTLIFLKLGFLLVLLSIALALMSTLLSMDWVYGIAVDIRNTLLFPVYLAIFSLLRTLRTNV